MDMPLTVELVKKAIEKEKEDAAWDLWTKCYPFAQAGYFELKPFSEFQEMLFDGQHKYSQISCDEIENEMLSIVAAYESM